MENKKCWRKYKIKVKGKKTKKKTKLATHMRKWFSASFHLWRTQKSSVPSVLLVSTPDIIFIFWTLLSISNSSFQYILLFQCFVSLLVFKTNFHQYLQTNLLYHDAFDDELVINCVTREYNADSFTWFLPALYLVWKKRIGPFHSA